MNKIVKEKDKCPYCDGEEFVYAKQDGYSCVCPADKVLTFKSQILYHQICVECGSVVRSFVNNPKKLITK